MDRPDLSPAATREDAGLDIEITGTAPTGAGISIVIPTYCRDAVLTDTLANLLSLPVPADEILVVDQTPQHDAATELALSELDRSGRIRWLRLERPSIPAAMNRGLVEARAPIVLFLDDDIVADPQLVAAHAEAHASQSGLVAGRVIQPWNSAEPDPEQPGAFSFNSGKPAWIDEFMGGNFSVRRVLALQLGGFDENFVRVAYRFEAEFAHRLRQAGLRIRYQPSAVLRHLKVGGGTRVFGDHLRTSRPDHSVGAYYFALRTSRGLGWLGEFLSRPWRAVATRHHLRQPWWIPVTWLAELRGMAWAVSLSLRGPRLLAREARDG